MIGWKLIFKIQGLNKNDKHYLHLQFHISRPRYIDQNSSGNRRMTNTCKIEEQGPVVREFNDVVCQCFVKLSNVNIANTLLFFVGKT